MAEADDGAGRRDARDQALFWFARLHSGDTTASDREAFESWLAAAPAHRSEYDRLAGVWSALDRVPDPRGVTPARPNAFLSRRRVMVGGAAGAGLVAAAALAFESGLVDTLTSDYHTAKGELRSVTLADDSRVELDADSALSVAFTDRRRRITLKRGRALFTVAKDATRPFSVAAAGGVTTALGTAFVVDRLPDNVTVSVIESAVMVAAPDDASGASRKQVSAGQQISYGSNGLGPIGSSRGSAETAWRQGRLVFENEPLGDVIAALNRYRSGTIIVLDSSLLRLRVSGAFDVRDPDQVLDAIRQTLPVEAIELTRYLVLLRSA